MDASISKLLLFFRSSKFFARKQPQEFSLQIRLFFNKIKKRYVTNN